MKMGKGAVAAVVIIIVAGGLFVGYPYYKDYLPFDLFEETVDVSTDCDEGGIVYGAGTYTVGSEFTIRAIPDDNYVFVQWSDGNKESTRTFTAEKDVKFIAHFAIGYTVSLSCDMPDAGTLTGAGGYADGTSATISVTENYGYKFLKWSDNDKSVTRTIVVDKNLELTAIFEALPSSTIVVNCSHVNGGTITGDGKLVVGESRDVVMAVGYGYDVLGWYDKDGNLLSKDAKCNVTAENDGEVIYLELKLHKGSYTLNAVSETEGACKIDGAGEYYPTDTATVKVTMNEGYGFEGIYVGDVKVSDAPIYSFMLADNTDIAVKSTILRNTSYVVTKSASEAPLNVTVKGVVNPDAVSRDWIVTDAITGETIFTSKNTEFSFNVESGMALNIIQTITYADGKLISEKTNATVVEQTYTRSISWRYQDDSWTNLFGTLNNASDNITYTVKFSDYYENYVKNVGYNKTTFSNCGTYVTPDDPLIQDLVKTFKERTKDMSDLNRANYILKFTQSFGYEKDIDSIYNTQEYWKYSYQTLFDMKGDCEDTTFLFTTLMDALGYDCVVLTVCINGDVINHMAAGVSINGASGTSITVDGKQYYYCETAYTDVTGYTNSGNVGVSGERTAIDAAYKI